MERIRREARGESRRDRVGDKGLSTAEGIARIPRGSSRDAGNMRHRIELPPALLPAFSVRDAERAGIGRGRRNARDLARPFHGVRGAGTPNTFEEKIAAYRPRLRAGQRYAGETAIRLWRLPHTRSWHPDEPLEIVVPLDASPPRTAGVLGHRLAEDRATTWRVANSPVVDPIAAIFGFAHRLSVNSAVSLLDAVVTDADNYPGLYASRPSFTLADLSSRLQEWKRFHGSGTIRAALSLVREHVESPKETETRLLLTDAGLPEPAIQYPVMHNSVLIARVDLAYPELKIAIEYEGDGHRTEQQQWRRDIQRQRDLEDRGWIVIRLTQEELVAGGASVLHRVRRALLSRTL